MRTTRLACLAVTACLAGCSSARPTPTAPASAHRSAPVVHRPRAPETLPQTHALPGGMHTVQTDALWRGIATGSTQAAMPAFFPLGAYLQVKAIADARPDYENRLVHDFRLDVAAAHRLTGADAQLVRVELPAAEAHWVAPGGCFNRVGYWEVPGARVVYRARGALRSFAIASLISWRGVWYVVHLGAVTRSADAGLVDDPQAGAGTPGAPSTC